MELVDLRIRCRLQNIAKLLLWIGLFYPNSCDSASRGSTNVYARATVKIVAQRSGEGLSDTSGFYIGTQPSGAGKDIILRRGDTIVLTCLAGGHPRPKTNWAILGGDLNRRGLNLNGPVLKITNIQPSEEGRITCKADNGIGGRAFATTRLNVYYLLKPTIILYVSKSDVPNHSVWFENTVVLRCETFSNPESTVTWFKNSSEIKQPVAKADGIEFRKITRSRLNEPVYIHILKIRNANSKNFGKYECSFSLENVGVKYKIPKQRTGFTYTSNIAEPRIYMSSPSKVIANPGDDISLDCGVTSGFPLPTVKWRRDNGPIPPKHFFSNNRKVLKLPNVQTSYEGSYFCIANNNVGNPVWKEMELVIRSLGDMQYWITPDPLSDDRKLEIGKGIILTCYTDAQPPEELKYFWYKKAGNGGPEMPITSRTSSNIKFINEDNTRKYLPFPACSRIPTCSYSRLEIQKAREENYGEYICRARLNGLNETKEASIYISKDHGPAQLYATEYTATFREGNIATISCKSSGRPIPQIEWLRDGNETLDGDRVRFPKNGVLEIQNVSRDDADIYTCITSRQNGFSKLAKVNSQADIILNVDYPPEVQQKYTVMRQKMESDLTLSCFVISAQPDDGITYTWRKLGKTVLSSSRETLKISPLHFENYGEYVCTVSNTAGDSKCVIQVTGAAHVPEFYYELEDMDITSGTDSSVTSQNVSGTALFTYLLAWTQKKPYAVDPVTEYRIRWRKINDKAEFSTEFPWYEDTKPITGTIGKGELIKYEIKDLATGSYEVEVTPITDFGDGDSARRIIHARKKRKRKAILQGNNFFCAFENDDICGFQQMLNRNRPAIGLTTSLSRDDFDWSWNNERNQAKRTRRTGPDFDYSSSKKTGGYMFIESSRVRLNQKARLISPLFQGDDSPEHCLRFFYHMKGRDIGRLSVIQKTTNGEVQLWNKTGEQGASWMSNYITFNHDLSYQIIFEAKILKPQPNNHYGDIAIDDVMLVNEPCPTLPTITAANFRTTKGNDALRSSPMMTSVHVSMTSHFPRIFSRRDICYAAYMMVFHGALSLLISMR